MLMCYGLFVFCLLTVPYRELQRQRNWKHRNSSRVGTRDASQFVGPGDDTITLTGLIAPANNIGTAGSLSLLAKMADEGDSHVLVDGTGTVYGQYIIESLNETASYHSALGTPRRIEFTLTLKRTGDDSLQNIINNAISLLS